MRGAGGPAAEYLPREGNEPACTVLSHLTPLMYPTIRLAYSFPLVMARAISALRRRERRLEWCYAPLYRSARWWYPIPGAKRERPAACMCGHMRLGAVSLTAHSDLTSACIHDQVCYSNVCSVRDEGAAGSNPATPTS